MSIRKMNSAWTVSRRYLIAAAIGAGGLVPAPAMAQTPAFPWCTQGSAIHCYYTSLQQCQETVDYHGFCIRNPDYQGQDDRARQRPPQ